MKYYSSNSSIAPTKWEWLWYWSLNMHCSQHVGNGKLLECSTIYISSGNSQPPLIVSKILEKWMIVSSLWYLSTSTRIIWLLSWNVFVANAPRAVLWVVDGCAVIKYSLNSPRVIYCLKTLVVIVSSKCLYTRPAVFTRQVVFTRPTSHIDRTASALEYGPCNYAKDG